MRKEYCNPAIFTLYKEPLMIVEGYMQYLYDETGRRYLDMLAGIVTVSCGHCHPKVTAKIKEQVDTLQHATTIYLHPNMPALFITHRFDGSMTIYAETAGGRPGKSTVRSRFSS